MKIVELQQGTMDWLSFRLAGIGSSDAPVVEGISPYRTIKQLFREKRSGKPIEQPGKEFIFARGHQVEAIIRREFETLTGAEMKPICAIHDDFEYLRASLDGFDPRLGVLEGKLTGQAVLAKARDGEIPDHHMSQMQHQFAVTGADLGQWFGHDGKKSGVLVEVRRNEEYIKRLLEAEHRFWEMVLKGIEPELTENDYLIPEDVALLQQLRDAKVQAENAALYYEQLRKQAVETYQHPKIAGAGIKILQVKRQGSINYKSIPELKSLDTEYLEKFRGKESVSWQVRMDGEEESA